MIKAVVACIFFSSVTMYILCHFICNFFVYMSFPLSKELDISVLVLMS